MAAVVYLILQVSRASLYYLWSAIDSVSGLFVITSDRRSDHLIIQVSGPSLYYWWSEVKSRDNRLFFMDTFRFLLHGTCAPPPGREDRTGNQIGKNRIWTG